MNIRKGFARIARVTAIVYWTVATVVCVVVGYVAFSESCAVACLSDRQLDSAIAQAKRGEPWRNDPYANIAYPGQSSGEMNDEEVFGTPRQPVIQPAPTVASSVLTGLLRFAEAALIAILIYLALWSVFRGFKWIALGFLDEAKT